MALGDPIPGVSNNELIRTTWGAAVAQEVNQSVKKAAAQTMAGPLAVTGKVTSGTTTAGNTPPTAVNDLTRKDYVDTTTVASAGDTMTGALLLPAVQSTNANAAVHKTYADTKLAEAGGTMTGDLEFGGGGGPGFSGAKVNITGHVDSTVTTNISNLALNKINTAITSGGNYILFERGTSGGSSATIIGSISVNAGLNGININDATITLAAGHPLRDMLDADDVAAALHMLAERVVTLEARIATLEGASP